MKKSFLHSRLLLMGIVVVLTGALLTVVFPSNYGIETALPKGNFSSEELFRTFTNDPSGSFYQYGNSVIVIEGKVAAAGSGYILLGKDMQVVRCEMRKTIYDRKKKFSPGQSVVLKGVCRGLNLTEILITHCVVVKTW